MDFSPETIFLSLMFSIIGFAAWRYGKQSLSERHMILGVGLMIFSYFIPGFWWDLAVGSILVVLLFWPKI